MSKTTIVDEKKPAASFQTQGYLNRKATAAIRSEKARKAGKACANCLWCWPDLQGLQGPKRRCYNVESKFYHKERTASDEICLGYEVRVNEVELRRFAGKGVGRYAKG